jgi:hypothetical protein
MAEIKVKHNYWAILVAALVYFVLGAGWFTLLSKPWMDGTGLTMEWLTSHAAFNPAIPYLIAFGADVVIGFALSCVIQLTGAQTAARGAKVAALLWLGFVFTTWATEYAFEERSIETLAIVGGYPLVGMVIEGLIIGAWKKK